MTSTPPVVSKSLTTSRTPQHPAHTILARAHPNNPDRASQIFTDKIKNKPLLLTPSDNTTDKRSLRRHVRQRKKQYFVQHQRPRPLSAKEKRKLKLFDLSADDGGGEEIRYSTYKRLNEELWKSYILDVLGFGQAGSATGAAAAAAAETRQVSAGSQGSLLASADFHGMEVQVVQCKDPGRVGMTGIVVRETKGTLLVVTPQNKTRKILKRGAVFRVTVELPTAAATTEDSKDKTGGTRQRQLVFELHGNQLELRPVDRAVRKFKWHPTDHL